MTRLLLLAAALCTAATASAQDPVTRRPGGATSQAVDPAPTARVTPAATPAAPTVMVLRGFEDWGTNGKLAFTVKLDGTVVMTDAANKPINGKATLSDNRLTLRFTDCVYEGTVSGSSVTGVARFTAGSEAGKTWTFRVRAGD